MSHYTSLNKLMGLYESQGLRTIGYPCNQFGGQEPGDGIEILHCVQCVRPGGNFTPVFPLTVKIDVNGALADSTWIEMKKYCPGVSGVNNTDIGWNFETIIFDRTGKPFQRYSSDVDPIELEPLIKYLLSQTV